MRHYQEEAKEQIRQEIAGGKSQNEVSREYGISRYTVQSWCGLKARDKTAASSLFAQRQARKIKTIENYEKENKRMKMENELLRDFLRFTGSEAKGKIRSDIPA